MKPGASTAIQEALNEHGIMTILETKQKDAQLNPVKLIDFMQTTVKDKDMYSGPKQIIYNFRAPL